MLTATARLLSCEQRKVKAKTIAASIDVIPPSRPIPPSHSAESITDVRMFSDMRQVEMTEQS